MFDSKREARARKQPDVGRFGVSQIHWIMRPFKEERDMLWTIFVILVVLWLLGFSFNIGGGLIHALLVIALIVLVYNLVTGRRS
jgi:Family of unknown function (DUF5670)